MREEQTRQITPCVLTEVSVEQGGSRGGSRRGAEVGVCAGVEVRVCGVEVSTRDMFPGHPEGMTCPSTTCVVS